MYQTISSPEQRPLASVLMRRPPGGKVGAAIARLFGADAETEIRDDLRRFKELLENRDVASPR